VKLKDLPLESGNKGYDENPFEVIDDDDLLLGNVDTLLMGNEDSLLGMDQGE